MLTEEEFYKSLATLIKRRRKDLKLTNEALFMLSGVDLSKISLLQNNRSGCNAYTLYKILFSLSIDIFNTNDIDKICLNDSIKKIECVGDFLKTLK